ACADARQLSHELLDQTLPAANPLEQALGALACRALGVQSASQQAGLALERVEAFVHELLRAPRRRAFDRRRLLGVGQLALHGLQAHSQDVRLALARAQASQEVVDLGPGPSPARIAGAGVPTGCARAGRRR